jgi:hypothetical protein
LFAACLYFPLQQAHCLKVSAEPSYRFIPAFIIFSLIAQYLRRGEWLGIGLMQYCESNRRL